MHQAVAITACPVRGKYVVILMDEIHVKEDLVNDKFSIQWFAQQLSSAVGDGR